MFVPLSRKVEIIGCYMQVRRLVMCFLFFVPFVQLKMVFIWCSYGVIYYVAISMTLIPDE